MLLGDLGIADLQAAATGRVDQLPGLVPRRILEGRAAGAAAQRLARLALGGDPVHLGADRGGIARHAREQARRRRSRPRAARCGDRCSRSARPARSRRVAVAQDERRNRPGCRRPRGHRRRRSSARSRRPCRGCRAGIRGRRCRRRARLLATGCRIAPPPQRTRLSGSIARPWRTPCRAARRRPARRRRGRSGWSRGRAAITGTAGSSAGEEVATDRRRRLGSNSHSRRAAGA